MNKPQAVPGVIVAIQTFGDLVNLNPHLHTIVSDGLFASNGWLYVVPDLGLRVGVASCNHIFLFSASLKGRRTVA